jgi:hypothetical protein
MTLCWICDNELPIGQYGLCDVCITQKCPLIQHKDVKSVIY